jgi:hypothetical protein
MLRHWTLRALGALLMFAPLGGCLDADEIEDIIDELEEIEIEINQEVDVLQDDDFDFELPDDLDEDDIIIDNDVIIIDDIEDDIIVDRLVDATLIGFENLTGLDAYYQYLVEGELQGVFVFDGETLLLEYPCLFDVELISEEYFDPATGLFEEGFEITDGFFEEGFDYECGDAIIFTFDIDGIAADVVLDFFD